MKKEKSLIFLTSKWLIISSLMLVFVAFGNISANAQSLYFADDITALTQIRDSFAPATAKYDYLQDAIDYLNVLETNLASDPMYLNVLQDLTGTDPLNADPLRRVQPSILANYDANQLNAFQTMLGDEMASNPNPATVKKLQWIIGANAY